MGTIATAFNNAFADGANVSKATCRGIGTTIETWLQTPVFDQFGSAAVISLRRANGTSGAPTAVASGDTIAEARFGGYYTTGGPGYAASSAKIIAKATEAWSSTALGSEFILSTTPNGTTAAADALWIGQDQSVLFKSHFGYKSGVGSGGAVTQTTSRTTGVTLNAVTGQITLVSAAASTSGQTFTLTNNKITANDTLVLSMTDASVTVPYTFAVRVANGSAKITVVSIGSTPTEQPVINFAIVRAAAS